MDVFVWVDSWQQQCCGDEFRVGSTVRWQAKRNENTDDWYAHLLGTDWAGKVRYAEDHHLEEANGTLTGTVSEIHVVTSELAAQRSTTWPRRGQQEWLPVPGSGRLRSVQIGDLWEPEPRGLEASWTFNGWLVKIINAEFEAFIDLARPEVDPNAEQ